MTNPVRMTLLSGPMYEPLYELLPTGIRKPEAVTLLKFLTSRSSQLLEATHGSVPVRQFVMHKIQTAATGQDIHRCAALEAVLKRDVLIPLELSYYTHHE